MYTIKSCGKAHSWCGTCKPDVAVASRDRQIGRVFSDEHRANMSKAKQGPRKPLSAEHKSALSTALTGRVFSAEHRANVSKAARARRSGPLSAEHKAALSVAMTGRIFSEKHRERLSYAARNRSVEHQARIGDAQRGIERGPLSDEHRRKISVANKRHMETCNGCGSGACSPSWRLTGLALDLAGVLIDHGYDLIPEVRFGPYSVDFYEPELHIAFEADGEYWHRLPGRAEHDRERDAYLLAEHGLSMWRFAEGVINKMIEEA